MPIAIKVGSLKYKDPSSGEYHSIDAVGQHMTFDSEAYARGTRSGNPVPTTDETWHNNSKYYKDLAYQYMNTAKSYAEDSDFANVHQAMQALQTKVNKKVDDIKLSGLRLEFYSGNNQLGYCELADKSIPYEKLSSAVQHTLDKMNYAMTSDVYDPHGFGTGENPKDPYTYSDEKNTILKNNLLNNDIFTINEVEYTGLRQALDAILIDAKGATLNKVYTINGQQYAGLDKALAGVLSTAMSYAENQDTELVDTHVYTVNNIDYTGLIAALEGVLSEAKTYSDNNITTRTYTVDETNYTGLAAALEGILTKANYYTNMALSDYKPYTISIVDELPTIGQEKVFYLIPTSGNNYEKWWYIKNKTGSMIWDRFGGTSTKVVSALPATADADPDTDYILNNNSGCMYYKYIDNQWKVIAGSSAVIVSDLPEVENANEFTDYYVESGDIYTHYRLLDDKFIQIGSNAQQGYSTEDIDGFMSDIDNRLDGHDGEIESLKGQDRTISGKVTNLQNTLNQLDTTSYEYTASYGTATVGNVERQHVYTLYRKQRGTEDQPEIVNQFIIQGGGGGGSSSATTLTVTRITASPYIVTKDDTVLLQYNYSSVNSAEEDVAGSYVWKIGKRVIGTGTCVKGINTFDATEFITNIGETELNLTVTDEGGAVELRTFRVQKIDLYIESSFRDKVYIELGQPARFNYIPHGNISKTVHFKLDGQEHTETTTVSNETLEYVIPAQEYGSHLLEVWMTATINNTEISTPTHIYKDIIWYDEQDKTRKPVIGCIYRNDYYGTVKVKQYDSLPIKYYVYDPTTGRPSVKRYLDDVLIDTVVLPNNEDTWNFQSGVVGNHTLRLECRNTIVTIVVQVEELGIDVSPVTSGLEIDFNPSGITNASDNRIWSNSKYQMTVSDNFDWNGGGYQIDNSGDSYFLIKAGSYVTFNYQMFSGGTEGNLTRRNGGQIKVSFMVENVQDVNAVWLSNVETTTTTMQDETTGETISKTVNLGLQLSAHEGWLKTNTAKTASEISENEDTKASNTYLYLPYSEQDMIDMDINIDPISEGNDPRGFVLAYEDGVPSKAFVYTGADRFYQQTPQPIKIGSDRCDIRIYRLKIYSRSLSTTEVMRNFIADSKNAITMLNKYNRNSIYYDTEHQVYTPYKDKGILDPERLAERVPNVKILMLETDHFTVNKNTFVKSSLRCIHAPGGTVYPADEYEDNWYFENGYHAGQGTTSDNYGQAGRNVDFLFNCDGTHKPSNKVAAQSNYISKVTKGYMTDSAYTETCTDWKGDNGKISLTRTSVPNNFFNLKVNIASSENVNNWLLQKRYNDFLPYTSPAKQRDSRIKNDMEFVPAILFIRETNPETTIQDGKTVYTQHKEFNDTNWHFYALGNLGDSKKTDYTRAYDPTDVNEFTIEISDNTKNNATFQSGVYENNGMLTYESFHRVKTLDNEGNLVITNVPDVLVDTYEYPVPAGRANDLLYHQGTIRVINETGDPQYDGDETGYTNYRIWCLYNEDFDGDHSFEPRYACCGDFRDGKLVNDTGHGGKAQVAKNNEVWRAFYKWVITATDEQFVAELDQWCVRSAMEFFYAFTHFHTMMDNRAKNTFWHFAKTGDYKKVSRPVPELLHIYCEQQSDGEFVPTTDTRIVSGKNYYTQYAFDIWDYDNDTALGINNNGELIFPYGKEDRDYNIDNDPTSGWIFNGADSAFWCRLRDLCSSEIANTFSSVVANECFNANNLINQFDTMQECFPEEVWRLDYERKYIRTFTGQSIDNSITEGKQAETYLQNMMQGKKKYQRRQWIRDQEMYFGTKYLMSNVTGDSNRITFRCYNPGSGAPVTPNYTLYITPFSDMYVSAMFGNGDTQQFRAKAGQMVPLPFSVSTATDTQVTIYAANRIAELNDLSACYITTPNFSSAIKLKKLVLGNTTAGYNNARLQSLTLGNNKMLQELDLRNCRALSGGLNLANAINLSKLYAENTQISAVTFAVNGKVQIAHLPPTVETLVMRGLNNLQDFQASLAILYSLTLEGGTLDNKAIVEDTLDTLYELRLDNIDWTLEDNTLLQNIYALEERSSEGTQNTFLTGTVHLLSPIKSGALANYQAKWPDLVIDTSQGGMIQQYVVRYINDDGLQTILYEYYVDAGSLPIDPYWEGLIPEPTKPKDERNVYSFGQRDIANQYKRGTGWDENLEKRVFGDTVILAQYTAEVRRFTVNWYALENQGPIYTVENIAYGARADYVGTLPKRDSGQSVGDFYLFKDWDIDTGYVTDDLNVYAVWEHIHGIPTAGKKMKNMTPIEIYAVAKTGSSKDFWTDGSDDTSSEGDYFDLTLGKDFDYSNVRSLVIGEGNAKLPNTIERETYASSTGYYFDGNPNNAYRSNIKLFSESVSSFTIAIDFQFSAKVENNDYEVLISNYELENASSTAGTARTYLTTGFRLYRYNNSIYLEVGGTSQRSTNYLLVGNGSQRDIVVIRYNRTTPNNIYVYGSYFAQNYSNSSTDPPAVVEKVFNISDFRSSEEPLSFGGTPFQITSSNQAFFTSSCNGILHWCKIWYTDLGINNCRALASWPREKIRMEYYGSDRYGRTNAQSVADVKTKGSWISNTALGTFHQRSFNYYSPYNSNGYGVSNRGRFLQERIWPTLPYIWQSIISLVDVPYYSYGSSSQQSISQYLYLPSYYELGSGTESAIYTAEVKPATGPISWMTSNFARVKFSGYIRRYNGTAIECPSEPTNYYYQEYPYGTIWHNTSNQIYYILVDGTLALHYNIPNPYPVNSILSKGGVWVPAVYYSTRSPSSSYYHYSVSSTGQFSSLWYSTSNENIVFGFSI